MRTFASHTVLEPEIHDANVGSRRWMVLIYNNDTNTFDEVVEALMQATGCGVDEAMIEAWEAHTYGKAPVHFSSHVECERVATEVSRIGVKTEVVPEWDD